MRFAYHRAGHGGVPIVLLHGWPQTSWAWRRVTPLLSPVCDVVVPDLPGFGYSSKPEGGFDKKTIARRLRDFVRALGLSRIALVGHDLGGHVAYAYAAQWPQEVSQDRRGERDLRGLVKAVRRAGLCAGRAGEAVVLHRHHWQLLSSHGCARPRPRSTPSDRRCPNLAWEPSERTPSPPNPCHLARPRPCGSA